VLCIGLATTCAAAFSQKVFRCGPGGSVYTHIPCDDGREVKVADRPTSDQRRQARQLAASEKRKAREIDRRVAREAKQTGKHPVLMNARPTPQPTPTTTPAVKQRPHQRVVRIRQSGAPANPAPPPQPQPSKPGR
jgi:hypothetical protein